MYDSQGPMKSVYIGWMDVNLISRGFILCYGHIRRGTECDWLYAAEDREENHGKQSKINPPASPEEDTDTRQHLNVVFIGHVGIKSFAPSLFLCFFCHATEFCWRTCDLLLLNDAVPFLWKSVYKGFYLGEIQRRLVQVEKIEGTWFSFSQNEFNLADLTFWYSILCISMTVCNTDRDVAVHYRCREVNYWRSDPLFDKHGGWPNNPEIWARIQGEESGKLVSSICLLEVLLTLRDCAPNKCVIYCNLRGVASAFSQVKN